MLAYVHYLLQFSQQPYLVGTVIILILQIQLRIFPKIFQMVRGKAEIWAERVS